MHFLTPRRLRARVGVTAVAVAAGAGGFASPALAGPASATAPVSAGPASATAPASAGPVSRKPASGTPQLVKTGKTEIIRQLVQCGGMMYAVGSFTTISQGGRTYVRNGVFSFKATAPYTVSDMKVGVNGEVNSIAFTAHRGCADAYIGGSFTTVHGQSATNIAEVSTSSGSPVSTFGRYANDTVDTLVGYKDHLLAGGKFTRVNGYGRNYYASLSPYNGKDDGFIRLRVSGHVTGYPALVYNQQLSHGGNRLLVEGNFT
jgi:hypothetical protein